MVLIVDFVLNSNRFDVIILLNYLILYIIHSIGFYNYKHLILYIFLDNLFRGLCMVIFVVVK